MTVFEIISTYQLELHYDSNGRANGIQSFDVDALADSETRKLVEENYEEIMRILIARKEGRSLIRVEK